MEESKENLIKTAGHVVGDLIYTVVFDTCNEIISMGLDQEKVLAAANTVVNNYLQGGIKVRKKPAPRPKVQKATSTKDKPIDVLKAAQKKLHSLSDNIVWVVHPDSDEYSYTTSIKLAKGYPVKNNATQKIEMVVNDETTGPLTVNDAKIALAMGMDINYDSVQQ